MAASLVVLAVQSAVGLIAALDFHSYDSPLDLDRNNGIFDIFSTAAIVAAALGAFLLAASDTRVRWRATALSAVLVIIAVEDVLQEEVTRGTTVGLFVIATLASAAVLIVAVARRALPGVGLSLFLALMLLLAAVEGALAYSWILDLLGRGYQGRGDLEYELGIVLKQGFEFIGWSLVAIGLWATALAARVRS